MSISHSQLSLFTNPLGPQCVVVVIEGECYCVSNLSHSQSYHHTTIHRSYVVVLCLSQCNHTQTLLMMMMMSMILLLSQCVHLTLHLPTMSSLCGLSLLQPSPRCIHPNCPQMMMMMVQSLVHFLHKLTLAQPTAAKMLFSQIEGREKGRELKKEKESNTKKEKETYGIVHTTYSYLECVSLDTHTLKYYEC